MERFNMKFIKSLIKLVRSILALPFLVVGAVLVVFGIVTLGLATYILEGLEGLKGLIEAIDKAKDSQDKEG